MIGYARLVGELLNFSPHLSAPLADKRYQRPRRGTFLMWRDMAS